MQLFTRDLLPSLFSPNARTHEKRADTQKQHPHLSCAHDTTFIVLGMRDTPFPPATELLQTSTAEPHCRTTNNLTRIFFFLICTLSVFKAAPPNLCFSFYFLPKLLFLPIRIAISIIKTTKKSQICVVNKKRKTFCQFCRTDRVLDPRKENRTFVLSAMK